MSLAGFVGKVRWAACLSSCIRHPARSAAVRRQSEPCAAGNGSTCRRPAALAPDSLRLVLYQSKVRWAGCRRLGSLAGFVGKVRWAGCRWLGSLAGQKVSFTKPPPPLGGRGRERRGSERGEGVFGRRMSGAGCRMQDVGCLVGWLGWLRWQSSVGRLSLAGLAGKVRWTASISPKFGGGVPPAVSVQRAAFRGKVSGQRFGAGFKGQGSKGRV